MHFIVVVDNVLGALYNVALELMGVYIGSCVDCEY